MVVDLVGTTCDPAAEKEGRIASRSRDRKRKLDEENEKPTPTAAEKKLKAVVTPVKIIDKVQLGKYEIDAKYHSPYPGAYGKSPKLWICSYCLQYKESRASLKLHKEECSSRTPPGTEIYRKGSHSIYEVDGTDSKLYCQNLALLGKLFLGDKMYSYDVTRFIFYILCEVNRFGAHIVGYFSKEKLSKGGNNLACILTLPPYQRKGYANLMIAFSYKLSEREGLSGGTGPEEPLSAQGRPTYLSYWAYVLLVTLRDFGNLQDVGVKALVKKTGIRKKNIEKTLKVLGFMKYWKGGYVICVVPKMVEDLLATAFKRPPLAIYPEGVKGSPAKKLKGT